MQKKRTVGHRSYSESQSFETSCIRQQPFAIQLQNALCLRHTQRSEAFTICVSEKWWILGLCVKTAIHLFDAFMLKGAVNWKSCFNLTAENEQKFKNCNQQKHKVKHSFGI